MGQETNGVNGDNKGDNEKKPTPENVTMFQGFEWNVRTRDFNRIAQSVSYTHLTLPTKRIV